MICQTALAKMTGCSGTTRLICSSADYKVSSALRMVHWIRMKCSNVSFHIVHEIHSFRLLHQRS